MKTFYFTFGVGHPLKDHIQPIVAPDYEAARTRMVESYGTHWAFQYTQEDYDKSDILQRGVLLPVAIVGFE